MHRPSFHGGEKATSPLGDRLEAAIRGRIDAVAEEMMAGPDADDDI